MRTRINAPTITRRPTSRPPSRLRIASPTAAPRDGIQPTTMRPTPTENEIPIGAGRSISFTGGIAIIRIVAELSTTATRRDLGEPNLDDPLHETGGDGLVKREADGAL